MKQYILLGAVAFAVAACGTPREEETTDGGGDTSGDGGTTGEVTSASAGATIYEAKGTGGGGYATTISYDSDSGTLLVDGLAFDGDNSYEEGDEVSSINGFRVFDGPELASDDFDSSEIDQFLHRAIYGESESGDTAFGIVRTGAYVGYGFGGFMYMRDGGVVLPSTGQANYSGRYAGIRTYQNQSGLDYVSGLITAAIDFEDFNEGDGVTGVIYNRQASSISDSDITDDVNPTGGTYLPVLTFTVGPGAIDEKGAPSFGIKSQVANEESALVTYESGTYYGLLSGDDAEEFVGIVVVEGLDPRYAEEDGDWSTSDVRYQETGGFIAYRGGSDPE